ncbi:unnamed protein product [Euphydryas editha]|uniref:Uncharacterized protein n=1 Tax=Euphydryas editha TaxID=104508 RepID=A0AAU9UQ88_EUPED|nr:unnamed protein product [Euphydryas editha]
MKARDVVLISLLSVGAAALLFALAAYLYIRRRRRKREDDEDGTSCAIRCKKCKISRYFVSNLIGINSNLDLLLSHLSSKLCHIGCDLLLLRYS